MVASGGGANFNFLTNNSLPKGESHKPYNPFLTMERAKDHVWYLPLNCKYHQKWIVQKLCIYGKLSVNVNADHNIRLTSSDAGTAAPLQTIRGQTMWWTSVRLMEEIILPPESIRWWYLVRVSPAALTDIWASTITKKWSMVEIGDFLPFLTEICKHCMLGAFPSPYDEKNKLVLGWASNPRPPALILSIQC